MLLFLSALLQFALAETAILAGGCFWCMEPPFEKIDGVLRVTSGYTGGTQDTPTYEQVSAGTTGHIESVEIEFDPKKISYEKILDTFWKNIDPLNSKGQFCDNGEQYRSAIFTISLEQDKIARQSLKKISEHKSLKGKPLDTRILKASKFYAAEDYHQDYYKKNPIRYKFYRTGCGRDSRLKELWN